MTDWDRVDKLRAEDQSWSEIAADPKVGFSAGAGADPGRALKTMYLSRRARGKGGRSKKERAAAAAEKGSKRSYRGIVIALVAMGLLVGSVSGYLILVHPNPPSSNLITYCGGEGQVEHYHILLIIIDSGSQQPLPYVPGQFADVGYLDQAGFTNPNYYCPNAGIHALHTHDGSGIVHAELPGSIVATGVTPTLADFFTIWGEPLDTGHVWSFSGKVTATMLDLDTKAKTDWSSNPGKIPFYVPAGGGLANAYTIPQTWIFSGQYGSGSSANQFGGEMIWLNITPSASPIATSVAAPHGVGPAAAHLGQPFSGRSTPATLSPGAAWGEFGLLGSAVALSEPAATLRPVG
ncbi:MAG: hypothetical protein L3K19_02740 [Thermoplasmata archaeon]|nr:hypothetical protein [Thermoplasmata archaeon]